MNKNRKIKENVVSHFSSNLEKAKTTFFIEYLGLTVKEISNLRNDLRAINADFKIYKNRLVKIATKKNKFESINEYLTGPNAAIFSFEDEIDAIRITGQHLKKNDFIKFKAGIFNGEVIDGEYLTKLSNIPPMETLLTQLASGLLQPLQQLSLGLNMLEESHLSTKGGSKPSEEPKKAEPKEVEVKVEKPKQEQENQIKEAEKSQEPKEAEINAKDKEIKK